MCSNPKWESTQGFIDLEKILNKKAKDLDSFFNLNMASNNPKFENWHQATENEIANFESEVPKKRDHIQKIVINKEKNRENDTNFTAHMPVFSLLSLFLPILNGLYNLIFIMIQCISCGTCEKVCYQVKSKSQQKTYME